LCFVALKKKHNKTGEESKYHGTIIGKGNDQGEVLVEGGEIENIEGWRNRLIATAPPQDEQMSGEDSRPPSSGLSSVGDRLDEDMDLS
jgi:transcription initiation factor TFIID subunit 3